VTPPHIATHKNLGGALRRRGKKGGSKMEKKVPKKGKKESWVRDRKRLDLLRMSLRRGRKVEKKRRKGSTPGQKGERGHLFSLSRRDVFD